MKVKVFTDGGSRNNPGPAGIGVVIYDEEGKALEKIAEFLGQATNNEAEYKALLRGMEASLKYSRQADFFLDSELLVRQLNGEYKVKNAGLKPLFDKAVVLKMGFSEINFNHIPRENNEEADKLVNQAIDQGLK